MSGTAAVPYEPSCPAVEAMMGQGTPFAQVDDAIETTDARQEQKAALWLLAWSLRVPPARARNPQRRPGSLGPLALRAP